MVIYGKITMSFSSIRTLQICKRSITKHIRRVLPPWPNTSIGGTVQGIRIKQKLIRAVDNWMMRVTMYFYNQPVHFGYIQRFLYFN